MTTGNALLDAMTPGDLARLQPYLRRREVAKDEVLIEQDALVTELHFPINAMLSNDLTFESGLAVETAVVGCEGVSGLAAFLADAPCAWRVRVQVAGEILIAPSSRIKPILAESPDLNDLFSRATHDYQAQAAQSAACNAVHQLTPRLARWILLADDRSGGRENRLTQEDLARALGVGRTTINEAANRLRDAGAIDYTRARMTVRSRPLLENQACECYAMQHARSEALGLTR